MQVFVSYARCNETVANLVVDLLRAAGFEVWWDKDMAGERFNAAIQRQIEAAEIVLCLLSPAFLKSAYCEGETLVAAPASLLPVEVEPVGNADIPILLRPINRLSLVGWDGSAEAYQAQVLIDACRRRAPVSHSGRGAGVPGPTPLPLSPPAGEPQDSPTFVFHREVGAVVNQVTGNATFNARFGRDDDD